MRVTPSLCPFSRPPENNIIRGSSLSRRGGGVPAGFTRLSASGQRTDPNMIHPTAIIDPSAKVPESCRIGPFCTVGPNVEMGEENELISHVVLTGPTRIGS